MSKKASDRALLRVAKGLYRVVPKTVQHKLKSVVMASLPPQVGPELSQTEATTEKNSKQKASKIAVTTDDVGTTYDPDIVFPMLAIENNVLHQQLRDTQKEVGELRRRLRSRESDHKKSRVPDETSSTLAEQYLAAQPHRSRRHLVLVNEYARPADRTVNKRTHQRVKDYLAAGVSVDVVCAGELRQEMYEFDGVRVLTGRGQEITEVLKRQSYTSVSVHFLNSRIWSALKPFLPELDVHVFVHRYETSRWVRKLDTYESGKALEQGIKRTIELQHFWHEVLHHPAQPKSYIFESDWRRRAASDDLLVTFPPDPDFIIQTNRDSGTPEHSTQESVRDQELSILGLRN